MTKDVPGECRMRSLAAPTCVPTNGHVTRFLSFAKLVRVIAYVHRFCHNAHYPKKKKRGYFKASDLKTALYACLERNLTVPEHFSAKARFPFNQGTLHIKIDPRHACI
jgi:hypothetical protein